jgi:glucose-1-phosphate cytidylyltransferase
MKAVILAGGHGTRLAEETDVKPKPMVEIGGRPILWHIMKIYSSFGIREFIICLGYKGYLIKEYFLNYRLHVSDVTIDMATGVVDYHRSGAEDWRVTLVDTGEKTMTGGRLRRIRSYLSDEPFLMTYGDGVANIDISRLVEFHRGHGGMATVTSVAPPGRFGALETSGTRVTSFREKPAGDNSSINGGFFVLSPQVVDFVESDMTVWEREPMEDLARRGALHAYHHSGFWQPMDTLRDKNYLEALWSSGKAPWKSW